MHLLSVQNLSFSWGYKPLFNELGFNLDKGQTIGIAGPNGCGKSSLVKILGGSLSPDRGQLALAPGSRVATVAQNPDFGAALTIRDCLLAETRQLADRLRTLEEAMAATTDESRMPALLARFGEAQGAFLAAGGYQADEQAERLLARTGLPLRPDQALTTLSGGERSVLSLVQALVADPDLLILDEPGNHLDYQGLAWLEAFLAELDKGIILVSHNRYLLDRVAGTIIYLEAGRHWIHRGSYSDFRQMRREQLAEERKAHAARERELQQLTLALKDLQAQAAQSYNPPARVMSDLAVTKRKIAELREIHDRGLTPEARGIRIKLKSEATKGEIALQVRNLSLDYDGRTILDGISFDLARGDRVALVGLNGSGKSSLIRLIREGAAWENPRLRLAPAMKVGYLSQQSPFGDPARSLVDEVRSWGPLSIDGAFNLIAPFAFPWEELDKPLATLSGGELQRLQLALLCYRQVNFLILDEPSNHLDIPGRETLEACLADFPGAMLIVSHDRYFVDSFARRILHLDQGRITEHEGNFSSFLAYQPTLPRIAGKPRDGGILNRDRLAGPPRKTTSPQETGTPQMADSPSRRQAPIPAQTGPGPEARIARLEAQIRQAEDAVLAALDTNPDLAARLEAGLDRKRGELEGLYAEWLG